tara:strand:+ start:394 stop:1437 length:1044 start_codon:yes stop_codon:yes gene_type:complete
VDKITIIGTGLIGGSIGYALKENASDRIYVSGYDQDLESGRKAQKLKAVDKAHWKLDDALKDAKMVILAVPVLAIRDMMKTISGMLSPGCIVTDTGSTKVEIMKWAEDYLPEEVSFVGGHPMAGKEISGVVAAEAALFKNARYAVIPGKGATEGAVNSVIGLVDILGAKPYFVDAEEHDSYVAAVSHLPIIMSTALVSATSGSPSWKEMSKLAATGFRDVSRLASGDPVMNLDISVTNRESLLYWIDRVIAELQGFREMVGDTDDEPGLEKLGDTFAKAWESREKWLRRFESGNDDEDEDLSRPELPSFGAQMMDMLVGSRLRERYQDVLSSQQERAEERKGRQRRR